MLVCSRDGLWSLVLLFSYFIECSLEYSVIIGTTPL